MPPAGDAPRPPGPPPPGFRAHLLALVVLLLLALLIYSPGLRRAAPTPEDYGFYGRTPTSVEDLAAHYLVFNSVWYRPSSFYLTYAVLSQFLDWHAVWAWKLVNLLTLVFAAFTLYLLILRLGGTGVPAALLGAIYFLTHPAVILPLYEVTAFDFLHLSASALVVIAYADGLTAAGWRRPLLFGLALVLYVGALTFKEVSYPLPCYLAALELFRGGPLRAGAGRPGNLRPAALRLLPFLLVFGAYTWLHVLHLPARPNDSAYRTSLNPAMVLENLRNYGLWMLRCFDESLIRIGWIRRTSNLIAVLLVVLPVAAVLFDLWRGRRGSLPAAREGLAWLLVFLPIPLFSGNYLHHILLPLFGLCLVVSGGWTSLLGSPGRPRLRSGSWLSVAASLGFIAWMHYRAFLDHGVHDFGIRMGENLLRHPVVPKEEVPPGAVFYIDDDLSLGNWWFGGGCMFAYAYQDRSVRQVLVSHSGELPEQAVRDFLREPKAWFVKYDRRGRFHDQSADIRARYRHLSPPEEEPAPRGPP